MLRSWPMPLIPLCCLATFAAAGPPETPKHPVADTYHGVSVVDEYRWLEDGADPAVRKWSDAENAYARSILDHLPHVAEIRARVTEIMSARTVSYGGLEYRRGPLFAFKREPPRQQPFIVVFPAIDRLDDSRLLVDPSELDKTGATSIDWYVPSWDGKQLAVSLSQAGTEAGDVHFFDVATGREIHEAIPRVNTGTAGGNLAWMPDGSGVFYTRHPRKGERAPEDLDFYQQVYFHPFGAGDDKDRYEIGKDFPRVAEIELQIHESTGTLLATVQYGDGGQFAHYLRRPDGMWSRLADFPEKYIQATFGRGEELYFISRVDAPRGKIVRVPLWRPDLARAELIVPEAPDTIVTVFQHGSPTVLATTERLYVEYQLGGPSEVRVFDLKGKPLAVPKQLPLSSVGGLTGLEEEDILFSDTSYIEPPAIYRYTARSGKTGKTPLESKAPVAFDDVEVVREFAVSKDGTKVPVNILFPKGMKRDGKNPALVTGYGGYGVSLPPGFSSVRRVLLDQGFVYAVANLRGGGEYGEPWHLEGNLTHKQNVFDDFAAVLKHLIDRGYTSPEKLAIEGGSNGGLLMGALLTQHPELVKAVVSHVGIYDMLRVELSPNGAFNIAEFGTVADGDQFRALFAYSPYHRVKAGTRYPAVLFLTGENDPRVDPMQSRKMTARLQQATGGRTPVLLRTSGSTGHGGGTPLAERIEQTVDVFAFLFDQLDVDFKSGKK